MTDVVLVFVVWVGIGIVACWHQLQTVKEQPGKNLLFFKCFVVSSLHKMHNRLYTVQCARLTIFDSDRKF